MDNVEIILAKAQINLTKITLLGFLLVVIILLAILVWPNLKASQEIVSLVSMAVGSLGTILSQQNGYFFARHRQAPALPEIRPPNPIQPASPANPEKVN